METNNTVVEFDFFAEHKRKVERATKNEDTAENFISLVDAVNTIRAKADKAPLVQEERLMLLGTPANRKLIGTAINKQLIELLQ